MSSWSLTVADDGCGMDDQRLAQLIARLRQDESDYAALTASSVTASFGQTATTNISEAFASPDPAARIDLPAQESSSLPARESAPLSAPIRTRLARPQTASASAPVGAPLPPVDDMDYYHAQKKRRKTQTLDAQEWWGPSNPHFASVQDRIVRADANETTPAAMDSDKENAPGKGVDFSAEKPGETIQQHGLGIPLIARIVLTHGGSIAIGSKKNEGFWITMRFTS